MGGCGGGNRGVCGGMYLSTMKVHAFIALFQSNTNIYSKKHINKILIIKQHT